MDDAPVMVFDTDCVLCSGTVGFILAHERGERLRFVGAWSEEGNALAARHGFTREDLNETFLVIAGGRALARSEAALEVARHLRAPWSWGRVFRIVPRGLRDGVYSFVARRRYRWFGYGENCLVIPPDARHRFGGTERVHR